MPFLVLVRHGQSQYNLENRFTGSVNVALTAAGEQEARNAGDKLKDYHFEIAYTSMLIRAQESLRIILEELHETGITVVKNAALNERRYGNLQGLNKAETASKYGVAQVEIWRRSFEVCPPGGESLENTYNRTTPYFQNEIAPHLKSGNNVLIVAHGNSLRALMMYLENIGHEEVVNVEILTGIPRLYTMDADLKIKEVKYI